MRKLISLICIFLFAMLITSCGVNSGLTVDNTVIASGYTDIKPEEAKKRMDNEKGIILLDVRTIEEYTDKHIPGSILIPLDKIEIKATQILTDKNAQIFVYCRSGRRSVTASHSLVKMGYTGVYNLGGIIDWPYTTETGPPDQ